jgi:hypothetical protein
MEYNVRFAEIEDIDSIMVFIGDYFKKNHILSRNRKLFEWQYVNDNKVNMVIGEDEKGIIQAILGYIPYSNDDNKDFSLALWKAKMGTSFLGVKLLMFLLREESHRNMFCNGINVETSAGIYHRLGIKTGKLKQFYRLCDVDDYRIAKVVEKKIPLLSIKGGVTVKKASTFEELLSNSSDKMFNKFNVPYKSEEYIAKRYYNHPFYEYMVYTVMDENECSDMAIVLRIQECNFSKALRVIDIIGDYTNFYKVTNCLDDLANRVGAEYIDMYESNLEDSELIAAGWLRVGDDSNIIPNYFAPYMQCNVEINYCTADDKIVLFKGDGDQDRPN